MDDLEEMDKLLETCNLPRLTHEEIENPNLHITSKKTESVIKNLLKKKSSKPYGFTGEFYQTCNEKLMSNPQKTKEAGTLSN